MTKLENAFIWLYVKSWELKGQHVLEQPRLWKFKKNHLKEALAKIVYDTDEGTVENGTGIFETCYP